MQNSSQIVILGAGPAGTACCLELLSQGVPAENILLIDRMEFPRDKLCGGGITNRGWQYLKEWNIELDYVWYARGLTLHYHSWQQTYNEPGLLATVDRWELDYQLLQAVIRQGVKFITATVEEIQLAAKGYLLKVNNQQIKADYLIGADGVSSQVRRVLGLAKGQVGKLFEVAIPIETNLIPTNELIMDFSPIDHGVAGYLWLFPYYCAKDNQVYLKFGIMDREGKSATKQLKELLKQYIEQQGFQLTEQMIEGYPERYFQPFKKFSNKRAMLIGDAWGVDAMLGEGIAVAFEQARYAAKQISKAWSKQKHLARGLQYYFPWTQLGKNHWLQRTAGNCLYGKQSSKVLKRLVKKAKLADFSQTSHYFGYGRLAEVGFIKLLGLLKN